MKPFGMKIPKETFEYIFEQIKQFYNVTWWGDYGVTPVYTNGKFGPPDYVCLYTHHSNLCSIFEDKLIEKFLNKAGITEDECVRIFLILLGVNTIYINRSNTSDVTDEEAFNIDPEEFIKHKLEPELKELHKFCHYVSSRANNGVNTVIKTAYGDKIELCNYRNYLFSSALKKYCEDHVPELKEKTYTEEDFVYKSKGGRPTEDGYTTSLLYGTFLLLKSFSKDNIEISDGICRIIYRFFKCLDIDTYSEQEENTAIKTIRARIKSLQKKSYKPSIGYFSQCSIEDLQNIGLGLYEDLYT